MTEKLTMLAVFPDLEPTADALDQLRSLGVSDEDMNVISGVPVTEAMLGRPTAWTNVPRLAMGGAIAGFLAALFLTVGTPNLYQIQVGRQYFVPVPPTVVLMFEITMLGMLLATFLGVFLDSFFPNYRPMEYVKEISDGKYAIFYVCTDDEKDKIAKAMTALGAEEVREAEAIQL